MKTNFTHTFGMPAYALSGMPSFLQSLIEDGVQSIIVAGPVASTDPALSYTVAQVAPQSVETNTRKRSKLTASYGLYARSKTTIGAPIFVKSKGGISSSS